MYPSLSKTLQDLQLCWVQCDLSPALRAGFNLASPQLTHPLPISPPPPHSPGSTSSLVLPGSFCVCFASLLPPPGRLHWYIGGPHSPRSSVPCTSCGVPLWPAGDMGAGRDISVGLTKPVPQMGTLCPLTVCTHTCPCTDTDTCDHCISLEKLRTHCKSEVSHDLSPLTPP